MTAFQKTVATPLGNLRIIADDNAVVAVMFDHVYNEALHPVPRVCTHSVIDQAIDELVQYFQGVRTSFDVPIAAKGTDFQKRVWSALSNIPYGQVRSYGDVARTIGNSKASRAVGMANYRNPIAIIVPCHRVIGSDGALTGYAGGTSSKHWLLKHEAAVATRVAA